MVDRDLEATPLYSANIFLVGIGQYRLNQLTSESYEILRTAKHVMHLSSFHSELSAINPACENLSELYWSKGELSEIVRKLAEHVVGTAETMRPVAFATHGNPLFANDICWKIIELGKQKLLTVQALPGISCLDVLPMQLGFDIGDLGAQIFEATQLVTFELDMNPYLSTLILQVAEFGLRGVMSEQLDYERLQPLIDHIGRFYPPSHRLIFIRSRSGPRDEDLLTSTTIAEVRGKVRDIPSDSTLYVPRVGIPKIKRQLFL